MFLNVLYSKRTTHWRCSQSSTAPLSSSLESGAHSVVIGVIVRFAREVSIGITKIIRLRVRASLMNKRGDKKWSIRLIGVSARIRFRV